VDIEWSLDNAKAEIPPAIWPDQSGRRLVDSDGKAVFLLGEALWAAAWKMSRSEFVEYLENRRRLKFNAIGIIAFSQWYALPNIYGDMPFSVIDNDWDTSDFIVTPGNDAAEMGEYDYWDHLDYIIDRAGSAGMYVFLAPIFGRYISGAWSPDQGSSRVLDTEEIYGLGYWFGRRYSARRHIMWVIGGDRSPIGVAGDYRDAYRALAEGIADGVNGHEGFDKEADYSTTMMTYWPRKWAPNSSYWFHFDEWLDFNSVQDMPREQVEAIHLDRHITPPKPTFLFEGRYEAYTDEWQAYQSRFQAYQSLFAGGFGHLYGHERMISLGPDWMRQQGDESIWREAIRAPGAVHMSYLIALFEYLENQEHLNLMPDRQLIAGDQGSSDNLASDRIQAIRTSSGNIVLVYSASTRPIKLNIRKLSVTPKFIYKYLPASGEFETEAGVSLIPVAQKASFEDSKSGTAVRFDPPSGAHPDWVLILSDRELKGSSDNSQASD
jgi:hypothetical protein